MKFNNLHQEFIKDEFTDIVILASQIIGYRCCDTVMQGNPKYGDEKGTKYQITPDPFSTQTNEEKINLMGFENYFYKNFGKWKNICYFDTPAQAFVAVIKAWKLWDEVMTEEDKEEYLEIPRNVIEKA